ncbi:glutamine synthetase-like [Babylonia areolata]|uniref:glutamine synthetase-like n=1 Tax=Babylonia areolata TaxID=304850 RepID=UPI003FCFCB37
MAESCKFFEEHRKYDYLQPPAPHQLIKKLHLPFILSIPAACLSGPNFETPFSIFDVLGQHMPNELMRPCLETLTPWPWVGKEGRRVGNVLCDLVMYDGTPDLTSPRQLMKAQLDALWERHGLVFKSAFEYEFVVLKAGSLERLGGDDDAWWGDVGHWGRHHDLFCDLSDLLEVMGVEVSTLTPEMSPGQWEVTTEPEAGARGGDVAFYVKSAVKGFFETRGYLATFMAKPFSEHMGSGLHLNHSLWTKDGDKETSVMQDLTDPNLLSSTARHWLAGVLAHSPALTALCCPTLNCYRRLFRFGAPEKANWGLDDRNALMRVRNARDNVFLENRLPSGTCNPYLAIAATVAAGLDGINRRLPCPKPSEAEQKVELPRTLAEALDALEKDGQLRSLLGDRFVECYVKAKRECEVQRFDTAVLDTEEKQMEFERKMYMRNP